MNSLESDEPTRDVDEDEDVFIHRWTTWAAVELIRLNSRVDTLSADLGRAQTLAKEAKELLEAYRKVQEASLDRIRIYEVGDTVYVGPDYIEAKVLVVKLGQGRQVRYLVGWWREGYNTATFYADDVEGDQPLARS